MRVFTSLDMLSVDYGDKDYPENPERVRLVLDLIEKGGLEIVDESFVDTDFRDRFDEYEGDVFDPEDDLGDSSDDLNERYVPLGEKTRISNAKKDLVTIDDFLRLGHSEEYIEKMRNLALRYKPLQPGIANSRDALEMAEKAVALTVEGAKFAYQKGGKAFALVRPPGHHAGEDYGHGFCVFNNAAIAAKYMAEMDKRVMIIDIDMHFGDGTADIVQHDPRIMYVSLHHRDGCLRASDEFRGANNIVVYGFENGAGDVAYKRALENKVKPLIRRYKPDLFVVSAGFDSFILDYGCLNPDMGLKLSQESYNMVAGLTKGKGTLVVLEGGYDPKSVLRGFECFRECF